ncbi:TPA: flagellar biosynthesis protein FlgA [Candidatus Dependentiae bacterium]|nr:MAG: SAF domain protein [candidate division TM6 bacterium GW2011_GWE2_31_21]KKP53913.1 MAG: SAF domain protein [candidate division TM6 bacterium GW2011_GWF2_33_332]HBS47693.1 flagellar biosynthesis protein FlgA [Candidatus Dependentiae bacterium]HBZ73842.1 flagellar biosynthesis protein FlgA [Candidatus Dependentiae bacterium]
MNKTFSKIIKIGNRFIGEGYPSYVIADIGANFDGSIEKAKKLILAAKESGADCAKFQSFKSKSIVAGKGFSKMQLKGIHGSWKKPIEEVFRDAEFHRDWHDEISDFCKHVEIDFSTAPYDFEAVDLCEKLNVPFIKIGSGDITWLEMLEYIARKNRPIFLSTGDATLAEVDEALRVIEFSGNMNIVLLQCITNYPSKIENANINVLKTYKTAFNILTGYSDHAPGPVVALGSVALGAVVIEKHFTLNKSDSGPDHAHSMDPSDFKTMVDYIRQLESAMGTTRKMVVEEEKETVIVQRRSLYAKRYIPKGKIIDREDLVELRPALGILPKHKTEILGKIAKIEIEEGSPVYWECF